MLEKRETYIRFSPIGTVIMWIMYIMFYFFAWNVNNHYYTLIFFSIWVFAVIIVTILSLLNSKNKGEQLLPKSIRYIIVNMMFIWIAIIPLLWWFSLTYEPMIILFPIVCIAYGLLIIVSRFCIQKFLLYFGYLSFLLGFILIISLVFFNFWDLYSKILAIYSEYYKEIIWIFFWFGHLIMWYLLHKNNK
jgi:hypothetical protein